MLGFQEKLESQLANLFSPFETEKEWQEFQKKTDLELEQILNEVALITSIATINESPGDLKVVRKKINQFEQNLRHFWRLPLDRLEILIWVAFEAGMQFNREFRNAAAESNDHVFEALTRLHAKACQTSLAILTLLKSGFADDAFARWRSLHEISVIGSFISKNGQELAEKYLLHRPIQQYKIMCAQIKVHGRNSEEEVSQEDMVVLEDLHDKLIKRFGKSFSSDYGWAVETLKKNRPTFRDIEEIVGLDHFRPYYRMASDNVHANSHGLYYRMGINQDDGKILLGGPSNAGLEGPGHDTAISLMQITISLLLTRPSVPTNITATILTTLAREAGYAFAQTHRKLEP
ncbi:MAG: DUF5677 domain-containing protein [Caldilineaceae bacterium]|nr:DUF5677 domain-containing protein [Caldilineaceae bacterium]